MEPIAELEDDEDGYDYDSPSAHSGSGGGLGGGNGLGGGMDSSLNDSQNSLLQFRSRSNTWPQFSTLPYGEEETGAEEVTSADDVDQVGVEGDASGKVDPSTRNAASSSQETYARTPPPPPPPPLASLYQQQEGEGSAGNKHSLSQPYQRQLERRAQEDQVYASGLGLSPVAYEHLVGPASSTAVINGGQVTSLPSLQRSSPNAAVSGTTSSSSSFYSSLSSHFAPSSLHEDLGVGVGAMEGRSPPTAASQHLLSLDGEPSDSPKHLSLHSSAGNSTSTSTSAGEAASVAALQKKNTSRRNAWGNMSYADLITQAINGSPEKRLTLSQIYEWMVQNVTYFKDKGDSNSSAGWKVSLTFFLSLFSHFLLGFFNLQKFWLVFIFIFQLRHFLF